MSRLTLLAALAGASAALQIPLKTQPNLETSVISSHLPLIDTEALQAKISASNLEKRAEELFEIAKLGQDEYNHPTRVIGSKGHTGTVKYITDTLAKLEPYYKVSTQDFPAVSGSVADSRLTIGGEAPKTQGPMGLTPPTKDKKTVEGNLVLVANVGCDAADFPEEVKGNIALIKRGTCPFGKKSENAGKAGAIAAVVYNTDAEGVKGTLGTPSPDHVATFGIGGDEGKAYADRLAKKEALKASAFIDGEVKTITTTNVIAQTVGGDQDNCVMLGGHSDSVAEGPGINDDGTGSLSLLEVATQLTAFSVNNCVRFAWWAGEEEGLLGSDYYVSQLTPEENKKIRMFMDYDMMGSPNFAYQVYNANNKENPEGSGELKNLYVDWYQSQGLNNTFIPFDGRSDYDAFIKNGIPGGGIATGAEGVKTEEEVKMFGGKAGEWYDHCYHQLCDDVKNVNMGAWEVNTKLIAHSVATYAKSLEGFPKRKDVVELASEEEESNTYHGPKAIM